MSKYLIITILIGIFISCDKIDGDYVESNAPFITDVVLFEFTGIRCPNCPEAHRVIEELQTQFGAKLHVIAIHAGSFALPWTDAEPDFRTEIGTALHDEMNIKKEYPSGSVMSLAYESTISTSAWASELGNFGWARPDVEISLDSDIIGETLTTKVRANFENDVQGNYNLCLFVVENSIIDFQVDGGNIINNYEHKHVLRASMNGTWGSEINTGSVFEKQFELKINSEWNTNNLEIIPFVYNTESKLLLPSQITLIE